MQGKFQIVSLQTNIQMVVIINAGLIYRVYIIDNIGYIFRVYIINLTQITLMIITNTVDIC